MVETLITFTVFFSTFAKVMFRRSQFVCLLAALRKNNLTNIRKIQWKGGTWASEEIVRF